MRWVTSRLRRLAGDESGQSTVEVALAMPVLLAVLIGAVQLALVHHAQDVTATAVREGARLAAEDGRTADDGATRTREVLRSGLGSLGERFTVDASDDGDTVTARAEGEYRLIIPWVTGRSIGIEAEAATRKEGFRSGP